MYQDFFELDALPFGLTPNTSFFCELQSHEEALCTLKFCINSGEGFIKIVGEVGSGKTLLCRKLIESLDQQFIVAYIPNPELNPVEMRKALAHDIGVDPSAIEDTNGLLSHINKQLIKLHHAQKKVVLLVDEAQALSDESLETIRLLTNLETESTKLLQVALFGQPELDDRLQKPHLRQLKQRITFSYKLTLLSRDEIDVYLYHRLAVAGYTRGTLFTRRARRQLYRASQGIPRLINILAHKALLVAYGRGQQTVDHKAMRAAVNDTEASKGYQFSYSTLISILAMIIILSSIMIIVTGGL